MIIDGCSDAFDTIYPIASQHFEIQRIQADYLSQIDYNIAPDAVLMIVGKPIYEQAIAWLEMARTKETWHNIPIIAYTHITTEALFFQAGVTDCWLFPTPVDSMVMRLNLHLQRMKQLYQYQSEHQKYQKAYLDQSQLVEIATHDLQHPINDLLMVESLLQQHAQTTPQIQPLLEDMNRAISSMQETLGDVLTALNLRGQMHFYFEHTPVAKILLDIGLKYTMRATSKQITVLVGQTDGMIYADSKRVMQIVENLVSNAIKYSPPQREVHLWSEPTAEGTYIRVRDWGVGVPPAERDMLFSEFGKLSSQPTGNENSIGLGLWVVKQLTHAMNGEVGATFPDEGGSIFWVRLPHQPPL